MVPGNFGCGSTVLAATATFAPSRAARKAMARPMPRLAPVMKSVLPLRVDMRECLDGSDRLTGAKTRFSISVRGGLRHGYFTVGTFREFDPLSEVPLLRRFGSAVFFSIARRAPDGGSTALRRPLSSGASNQVQPEDPDVSLHSGIRGCVGRGLRCGLLCGFHRVLHSGFRSVFHGVFH